MILQKKKICKSCNTEQYLYSRGRCKWCAQREDYKPMPRTSAIKKVSPSRIVSPGSGAELNRWFAERREEMKGFCVNCGRPSCAGNDKFFKFSIAHILPKKASQFPSVATHPDNWIELCFWGDSEGGSCHTNLDNNLLDMTQMNCWNEIVEKFQRMYPSIAPGERKNIPSIFRNYIEIDI